MADLHLGPDRPTAAEAEAVDAVLADHGVEPVVTIETERLVRAGTARRRAARHLVLPCLHALQRCSGWISPGGLNHVADRLQVPPAEAYGVASFYELFRVDSPPPRPGPVHHVCVDAACRIEGSLDLLAEREAAGEAVVPSPCLGRCERPVAVFVQGYRAPDEVVGEEDDPGVPQAGESGLRLLGRIADRVDPGSLEAYRAAGGFQALQMARRMGPDGVIDALDASGLTGRGGAGFPTGVKWRAVREAVAAGGEAAHIVVNADESEPGTFKDRTLIEGDPFALVESILVAAEVVGAERGWVYLRGEYPRATARIEAALAACRRAGLIASSNGAFDIEVRRGAGAYICGEETALLGSIEGFRGEPRNKPPFPTTQGLFGRPTVINNPETLLNVLPVLLEGPEAYRSVGTAASPGTRLFCLSGRVARPGVYELPFGVRLGELIEKGGGVTGSGELAAVLLGGAAGSFVGPDVVDMPLSAEGAREAGATLGSGVVMVFDTSVDLVDVCRRIADFFRSESCGQCVPCRVGTVRQVELVERIGRGPASPAERAMHRDLDQVMADASICGLGHTAASALRSALELGLIGGAR